MIPSLLLTVGLILPGQSSPEGSLGGIVVDGSRDEMPVAGAGVALRVRLDGQLVTVAETTTDAAGCFLFEPLPVDQDYVYLPGANRGGVHYPGPNVKLTPERPRADVRLVVHDAVEGPNPLVIRRYEIDIRPAPGAINVTETILVDNPTSGCYVGPPAREGVEPVTLVLNIPSDFHRTTFDKEFFGRRFKLVDGKLVTGIPWPPGERELKFTYVLRNSREHRVWERPLDLPCSQLRLSVHTTRPKEVSCNLEAGPTRRHGDQTELVFQSRGETLQAGRIIRVELGRLPVAWMVYGRWAALAILGLLIAGASFLTAARRTKAGNR